jgi:hypothetical protein
MINPLDSFIKPRTGTIDELSTDERELAATEFCTLVDDILLGYADKVAVSHYTTIPNTSWVGLRQLLNNGSTLHIFAGTNEIGLGSSVHERRLSIREYDEQVQFQRQHYYKFTPGFSEVVRTDNFPLSPEESALRSKNYLKQDTEKAQVMSLGEIAAAAAKIHEQVLANTELDRQMGFNHLPVDVNEVDALRVLVNSAELIN